MGRALALGGRIVTPCLGQDGTVRSLVRTWIVRSYPVRWGFSPLSELVRGVHW